MTKADTLIQVVRLGYVVGTGEPVQIPIRHMCVTGQTQEAGKTTTLEALIARSHRRALTFITKRAESAFAGGRQVRPYFREQADWRFVSSLLEAFLGERMKFERSWIMRASKHARTLADVRRNVTALQVKARGLSADVYMVLAEYLDELVPAIAAVQWATRLELKPGVNVVDLSTMPASMQHLVIKSSLDWVLEHEADTIVVIPEAWKFAPQGRGTPVKLSALAFIRQGAALGNYLWVDSQDIGGVEKELLRSCPVWLLGVQREANEIKRTLLNIPATVAKPKAADVALLELGQFFACWGKHAIRTYVQPAWLADENARRVAVGELTADWVRFPVHGQPTSGPFAAVNDPVPTMDEDGAVRFLASDATVEQFAGAAGRVARAQRASNEAGFGPPEGEAMTPAQEKKLDALAGDVERLIKALSKAAANGPAPRRAVSEVDPTRTVGGLEGEEFYQWIKARLIDELPKDPRVMEIVVSQPELRVKVKRAVVTVDGTSLTGRLVRLLVDGFFDGERRSANAARVEMNRRGWPHDPRSVGRACDDLAAKGFLRKDGGYMAVESMKRNIVEEEA